MTLSDLFNRKIEVALLGAKISSASPGHVNTVFLLEEMDHSDIDDEVRRIVEEEIAFAEIEAIKAPDTLTGGDSGNVSPALKQEITSLSESLENLKESPFGTLSSLTSTQVGNLQSFSRNPFQFFFTTILKKFGKGAGVLALAGIIFAAVQLIISELMKPGRALDRRFRRVARDEIFLFNSREEVAELRQGFRTVTVTTMPYLMGAEQARGQVSGNLYNPTAIPMNRIDPRRAEVPLIQSQSSSRSSKFFNRRNRGRR